MSEISRRALFGIGAGAATAALVPMPAKPDVIVGMDFGTPSTMVEFEFTKAEMVRLMKQQFPEEFMISISALPVNDVPAIWQDGQSPSNR